MQKRTNSLIRSFFTAFFCTIVIPKSTVLLDQINAMEDSNVLKQYTFTDSPWNKPHAIMVPLITSMANEIGTKAICNEADIPVIFKNIFKLTRLNKTWYKCINSEQITNTLIHVLAQRFGKREEDIAAYIKTTSGQNWLEKYITTQKLDITFNHIKNIISIAHEVGTYLRKHNINYIDRQVLWSSAHTTAQGFILCFYSDSCVLTTPFGGVELLSDATKPANSRIMSAARSTLMQQELFKRIGTQLLSITKPELARQTVQYYKPLQYIDLETIKIEEVHNYLQEISYEQVTKKNTEQSIITSEPGLYCLHEVISIDTAPAPPVIRTEKYPDANTLETLWQILYEESYGKKQEENDLERIDRILQHNNTITTCDVQMPNTLESAASAYARFVHSSFNEESATLYNRSDETSYKIIACKNYVDCRIAELLTKLLLTTCKKCLTCTIRYISSQFPDFPQKDLIIEHGLQLAFPKKDCHIHSLDEMQLSFGKIIKGLQSNWHPASLIDHHSSILNKKSEEEWSLFIKTCSYNNIKSNLIRYFVDKFCLNNHMICFDSNIWLESSMSPGIYMLIRKDAFEKVQNVFNFNITPKNLRAPTVVN